MESTRSRHGGANVRVPPPLVFGAAILAGWCLHRFVFALPVPGGELLRRTLTATTGLAGLLLILLAHIRFSSTGQDPRPWKPSPALIGRGPYRYSRNPMYLAMVLLVCGVGFALDTLWMVILAGPALAAVHHTAVLKEEAYLLETFGESYADYVARTPRYLGWWRRF